MKLGKYIGPLAWEKESFPKREVLKDYFLFWSFQERMNNVTTFIRRYKWFEN